MPYKRSYRKKNLKKKKSLFPRTKNTNSLYRRPIPRTLQIADRRNKSQVLRFVTNQTYRVVPGGTVGGMENVFLNFRANSIYNILDANSNAAGTFVSQAPSDYGPSVNTNATGWHEWDQRYAHFTVLGSRLQCTFEPTNVAVGTNAVPATFYIALMSGNQVAQITAGKEMSFINKLPYTKRASISPTHESSILTYKSSGYSGVQGVRLDLNYSAKKFAGVHDVTDNDQLKGGFNGSQPNHQDHFIVGLRNTIPSGAAADRMPEGILRIKLQYIVKLTEPTLTNQVQEPSMMQNIFG